MKMKAITSCKKATRLMSEQLDHPLPLFKWILLKIHLMMCINCVYFGNQIKALKDLTGQHTEPEDELLSPYTTSLSSDTRERIKLFMRKGKP